MAALVTVAPLDAPRQGTINPTTFAPSWGPDFKRIVHILNFYTLSKSPQWGSFGDN